MNTTKNSKEMKTVVETFIVEETAELIYDNEKLDRWNELVKKLNLSGQTQIISDEKSPIPFMHLNEATYNIITCLCPKRDEVEKYNTSPIPVEILDLIALSKKENYFTRINIYSDTKTRDPFCVGEVGYFYQSTWAIDRNKDLDGKKFVSEQECKDAGATASIYFTISARYLIGKWADVKHSFEELKKMASKRFFEDEKMKIEKKIIDAKRELEDLESTTFIKFNQ